ncbi:MAG: succinyl-diaminopimelate desuccinylase [Aestuariivita sp.]|nr:succinyl-diaminopimelate desuccinylase [Aestuariivita sp.]MCY4347323.1 succinyl-diaminopimelate desuccinylase [Aestuariivita sp.]
MLTTDPVQLTAKLVRCPSVTPNDAGALTLLQDFLTAAQFSCRRVERGGIINLFARWGKKGHPSSFGFNGHTDVVPVGEETAWTYEPFSAKIVNGILYGRGASDMKSGVAAFASAAIDFVTNSPPDGAIILAITGDEEGVAEDGTLALLDYMEQHNERMTACLVGEPTCPENLGDALKIGRRGSISAKFTAIGTQGHSAYPHLARNPIPALAQLITELSNHKLDDGSEHFGPSTIEATTIDTGNKATNVIPARCSASVNIRFNDQHSASCLTRWLQQKAGTIAHSFNIDVNTEVTVSGESFLTPPGWLTELVANAVAAEVGIKPKLSTSGGTSDARFIKAHCPVVEFGLVGKTMHQIDECVSVSQIQQLKSIYERILQMYFG